MVSCSFVCLSGVMTPFFSFSPLGILAKGLGPVEWGGVRGISLLEVEPPH